jgi:hypothetical protein
VLPFLLALLLICAVAVAVVAAFAAPHLQAGAPVLTPKGERVMGRMESRLRPVIDAVWPRVRAVIRPIARVTVRVLGPAARWARRRMDPVIEPIIQAVAEGSVAPRTPAAGLRPVPPTSRAGSSSTGPDDDPAADQESDRPAGVGGVMAFGSIPSRRIDAPSRGSAGSSLTRR